MNTLIRFRYASLCDSIIISKLGEVTFVDTYSKIIPDKIELSKSYAQEIFEISKIEQELKESHIFYFVAEMNNQVIGYSKLVTGKSPSEVSILPTIELEKIYLLDNFKGQGIGKKFIQFLINEAKNLNVKSIWLAVFEENLESISFYNKLGFKKIGSQAFEHEWQGQKYSDIDLLMQLKI